MEQLRDKYKSELPASVIDHIRTPWPSESVLSAVMDMTWRIVSAGDGRAFLTADNPAFLFQSYGLGRPESELTFPLASGLALLGSWQGELRGTIFVRGTASLVKEVNRRVASGAERFVFYHARNDWVAAVTDNPQARLSQIRW